MKARAVAVVLALLASAHSRAVAVAGALLALFASTHRHALTAEVEFYCLSQRKTSRSLFTRATTCNDNTETAWFAFYARICSRVGTQSHQCKLSSRRPQRDIDASTAFEASVCGVWVRHGSGGARGRRAGTAALGMAWFCCSQPAALTLPFAQHTMQ